MILKAYQSEALDRLEAFFKRCKLSNDPRKAYEDTTEEWRGVRLTYRALSTLSQVPYVCLRIPTGGGKTLIGGLAIERANKSLLFTRYSVTLWLVPSEPIREQTLRALRTPTNLLHQVVFSALGEVTVMDLDEALRVKPHVLNATNAIIVATMQAFKQEDMARLNVYKQNSDMQSHFEGITDPRIVGNQSFVDAIRMRRPFVIVDEAHNQGTLLAFETLARFEPSAILELTATPDRIRQPSNVLYSVGASSLQAAEMIKMPLELVRRENWQDALRDAIACLNKLQAAADAEKAATGEYLRPIMLLQAERHSAEHETLTPEKVKQALIDDFSVPEGEIAIATGAVDDLAGEDVLSDKSSKRFIITIDKLREGWDCPFAYVLCSFRNTESATAAEQILGRILRMPKASRKTRTELNEAYAFITSTNFQATVASLRDGLVRNGFERQETNDLIHAVDEPGTEDLFTLSAGLTFSAPELPAPEAIPAGLTNKIEIAPEMGTITIKGSFSAKQAEALEGVFQTPEGKESIRLALVRLKTPAAPRQKTPSEQGELFRVPLLALRQGDLWEPFEETHLLQGEWRLLDFPCEVTETEFKKPQLAAQGGRFFIREESIKFEYIDNIEAQLALLDIAIGWDQVQLVSWLERNIPDESILPDEKAAFLDKAVSWLITTRGFSLEELSYAKFRLRAVLENKITEAKQQAMAGIHQQMLLVPEQFIADGSCEMVFQHGRYAFDDSYQGFVELPKHFFPEIGNLKASGEEFECALFLSTQLPGLKYWVRNVERKPTSFSLQTATDRFYPDFVCKLDDGRILVVEYKNSRDWDLPDNAEKRRLGELWEARSSGKGLFIMPKGKDFEGIRSKLM
ncbi:MAG: DEAD/DEAH box helicase family protein [Nitrospirota bacterium]|nr:DEAD/DEAH box helicase family protein [Nitrospirota bacterium]